MGLGAWIGGGAHGVAATVSNNRKFLNKDLHGSITKYFKVSCKISLFEILVIWFADRPHAHGYLEPHNDFHVNFTPAREL